MGIGSKCEHYSKSEKKWVPAIVVDVKRDEKNKEWMRINYGNPNKGKDLKRFAKSIRPISKNKISERSNKKRTLENDDLSEIQHKKKRRLNKNMHISESSEKEKKF